MNVINFVLFQACWFACVYFAGRGLGWPGPLAVALFALWQLTRDSSGPREWILVGLVAGLGLTLDTIWIQSDLLTYSAHGPWPEIAPGWIVALWVNFALTLNHSLAYLRDHPWYAAALGAIGGPLSYWVAIKAWNAAAAEATMTQTLVTLAVAWALATPLIFLMANRLTPARPGQRTLAS